jgi:hypothetical protein
MGKSPGSGSAAQGAVSSPVDCQLGNKSVRSMVVDPAARRWRARPNSPAVAVSKAPPRKASWMSCHGSNLGVRPERRNDVPTALLIRGPLNLALRGSKRPGADLSTGGGAAGFSRLGRKAVGRWRKWRSLAVVRGHSGEPDCDPKRGVPGRLLDSHCFLARDGAVRPVLWVTTPVYARSGPAR